MNFYCPTTPNTCVDPALPVSNYSSEEPDREVFIGRAYSTVPPPLGGIWYANSCTGRVQSTISQQDADNRAAQEAINCLPYLENQNDTDGEGGGGDEGGGGGQIHTYLNEEQTCEVTCPDGNIYSFTVLAGTITAFSQAAANAQAYSQAYNEANATRICIGDLTATSACLGEDYDESVTITVPNTPAVVFLSAGALPTGMSLSYDDDTFTISGTASGEGTYTFTIHVEDVDGNYTEKGFTINVARIATTTLADGETGQDYSEKRSFIPVPWTVR